MGRIENWSREGGRKKWGSLFDELHANPATIKNEEEGFVGMLHLRLQNTVNQNHCILAIRCCFSALHTYMIASREIFFADIRKIFDFSDDFKKRYVCIGFMIWDIFHESKLKLFFLQFSFGRMPMLDIFKFAVIRYLFM